MGGGKDGKEDQREMGKEQWKEEGALQNPAHAMTSSRCLL